MVWQAVTDYMAEQTADLVPYHSEPVSPFGWGSDLDCADDLTDNMAELNKDDLTLVVQACYRRLTTDRGTLADDPDYGLNVLAFMHAGLAPRDLATINGRIIAELTKDDRLETVEARTTFDGKAMTIEIRGSTRIGEFSMTMGVTAAAVLLLSSEVPL